MTAKLPKLAHGVKLLVASCNFYAHGLFHYNATFFFFESVSKEKPMLPDDIFNLKSILLLIMELTDI